MNKVKNAIKKLFFVLFIFLFDSNKCSSDIVLDRPDLRLNLIIDYKDEVNLKAFKSSLNDEILSKEIIEKYNKLEWYSIGYPQLNKIENEYFVFKPNEFYVEIQMLNDPIREKFKEEIQKIYNINVTKEKIKYLELDQMNCSFEFETENGNLDFRFNGYVKSFIKYPLRLNFKYGKKLKERIEFEEAIKKFKNKTDQLDIEIDCKISLNDYNDKFTIFSKENSKSNELLDKNEKCQEEIEKKIFESEKRSNETIKNIILKLNNENNFKIEKFQNQLNKIEEKNYISEAKMKQYLDKFKSEIHTTKQDFSINEQFYKGYKRLDEIETKLIYLEKMIYKTQLSSYGLFNFDIINLKENKTLNGHSGEVFTLVELQNGDLASGSGDKTIKIWNVKEGKLLKTLTGHSSLVVSLVILPNGDLVSGSADKSIKIWNTNEGKEIKTLTGHSGDVFVLVVLQNGDLASGSQDHSIKIWNTKEGKEIKTLAGHSSWVFAFAILPNGDLVSGSRDNSIKIWDIKEGKELKTLTGHSDCVRSLVVLPNGDLASGSWDTTIKIWNTKEGKELRTLTGHSDMIVALAVLPNGDLASVSCDKTIKIWNTKEGKELKTLSGHSDCIHSLVVLANVNNALASGSSDKSIKIWNQSSEPEIKLGSGSFE